MVIFTILTMITFAVAFAIKGGSGAEVLKNWNVVRKKSWILDRLLDGKILSTIIIFVYCVIATAGDVFLTCTIPLFWLLAVAPSMGEEHGAIGDWDGVLDGYKPTERGRLYDIKKGLQRGVWMGASMAIPTGFIPFILVSFFYVPVVFIGQTINRLILRKDGWMLAELLIGAVLFGIPMALYLGG